MRRMKTLLQMAMAVLVAASAGVWAAVPRYRVDMFVTNDGLSFFNQLSDLNDRGQVVGREYDRPGGSGFLWSHGSFQGLVVDGYGLDPARINNRGQIAGDAGVSTYLYDPASGRAVNVNPAPDRPFRVVGLSDAGHVIGDVAAQEEAEQYFYDGRTTRAMGIWQQVNTSPYYVEIYDFNDRDVALGSYLKSDGPRVNFTWHDGVIAPLPEFGGDEFIYALNNAGHVAGALRPEGGVPRPVLFRDDTAVDLLQGAPGQGFAFALNERDWVVGSVSAADGSPYSGFLYRDGRMYDLNDLLVARDAQRWSVNGAFRINEAGQMLVGGIARDNSGLQMQALITPVPEPQAAVLMLLGLGLLHGAARNRCKPNPTPGARRRSMPA